jgi:hypothetical protein
VRSSIVGRNARVGARAVISDLCVVADEAEVPPGSRLSAARVQATR